MTRSWLEPSARNALRVVLVAGLLASLAANLPGHLSLDSVVALYEGHTGIRQTWAPAIGAWLLGRFDDVLAGTGLYVTASAALAFAALVSLADLRPRTSWAAPVVAAVWMATPQWLLYQGIVWKDVLFANLVVAGFACLAHAAREWSARRPLWALAGALACLTLASLVRQNGLILAALAAIALAWTARRDGWRSSLAWGAGGLAAVIVLGLALNAAIEPRKTVPKLRADAVTRVLEHYDIVGALAHQPGLPLDILRAANPQSAQRIAAEAPHAYSAERVETLDQDEVLRRTLWRLPDAAMAAQWREVVLEHPGAYLAHRLDVFRWLLAPPVLERCLPAHVGVTGPPAMLAELNIAAAVEPQDAALARYAQRFYATPVYSHLAYAVLALLVTAAVLLRRDPADYVIAGLMAGALAFTASFFVISVACDYRYLYALDFCAMAGLLYLALDPPFGRRRAVS